MLRILILGGSGFLGSNLALELSKTNKVFVIDIIDTLSQKNYYDNKNIVFIKQTLNNTDEIIKIINLNEVEIIIHSISLLLPSSGLRDFSNDVVQTYLPTLKLLEYCSLKKIKFVFISSGGTIYGDSLNELNEDQNTLPITYYGLSKLNIEKSILYYNKVFNLDYLILRPSNPYGYGQNIFGNQGLIAIVIGKIINKQPIKIWGNGEIIRDYIYIEDFSKIVAQLINSKYSNNIINIGSGEGYTINEILSIISEVTKSKLEIIYEEKRSVDIPRVILDISKIRKTLNIGFTPIDYGIKQFYNKVINELNARTANE